MVRFFLKSGDYLLILQSCPKIFPKYSNHPTLDPEESTVPQAEAPFSVATDKHIKQNKI